MSPVVMKPGSQSATALSYSAREDQFSLPQALRDWLHLIITPNVFFEEEEGATGFKAPSAVLVAYTLAFGILWCLIAFASVVLSSGSLPVVVIMGTRAAVSLLGSLIFCALFLSVFLHGVSRLCGGTGEFSGTFRAVAYALSPYALLSLAVGLCSVPSSPLSSSVRQDAFMLAFNVVCIGWATILLAKGMRATQKMSLGGAFGAVIVTYLLLAVLAFALTTLGLVTKR